MKLHLVTSHAVNTKFCAPVREPNSWVGWSLKDTTIVDGVVYATWVCELNKEPAAT